MTSQNGEQVRGMKVSIEQRNELATNYLPLVRKIARGLSPKIPPQVSFDDLVGAGLVGLMDAASRFDPEKKAQFGSFVATRVRGAMIDELRTYDPLSRDLRALSNQLSRTIHNLTHELGRQPEEPEIAEAMGVSMEEYFDILMQLQQASFLSPVNVDQALENYRAFGEHNNGDPQSQVLFAELQARLARAIARLSEKEQRILSMYYKDECSLKEIGDRYGVTDSRVCQIRTQAIHRLRALLDEEVQ